MLDVEYSTRFKKDIKNCKKRHNNIEQLKRIVDILRIPEVLPFKNFDHILTGDYIGYRECHIAPDWLLIYRYRGNKLFLFRTGTHADLFGHNK
ncbi:MAG: type II toxin-antitoxin system YafQ family toxin [Oscillibacter sp.]|nr:type II toxin-antitoxin system YafQ family toxin [Oscillibacter sp.]